MREPHRGVFPEPTRVEQLTWDELAGRASDAVGVLPVGSACKEHGLHLPLGTDLVQANWIAGELASRRDSLVWPAVQIGFYPAFFAYPGSVSLDERGFRDTLACVLDAMTRAGHHRCVVLNTGISTIDAVNSACAAAPDRLAIHVYGGERFRRAAADICSQTRGGHADEIETSLMLHIAEPSVRLERARDESGSNFAPGPLNPGDPAAPNYSPSGAMGNPTLATAAKGRVLAAAMIADVLASVDAFTAAGGHG